MGRRRVIRGALVEAGQERPKLTGRQQEIYEAIVQYCEFLQVDACPASYIADRFHVSHETVRRDYFGALAKKGWIRFHATPAQPYLKRQ